ncbi:MAG: DUF3857 domain-containing protein [Acidobacteria bacterium]|nr:DUF3857 domain-containing protein [Acidobacteriota bacterium]
MRSTAVLFALALMTPTAPVLSQSAAPPAAAAQASDYSAESVVVERLDSVYRFAADGTGSREVSAVLRIQSDAAARQYGVLNFSFAGNSEHVEIDYVRARKPDGSVVETPPSGAQEMPQEVTRQAPFYSDLKEKQVPVRNLRMGDRLEYKVRVVGTKAEAPGQFWGQETLGLWAVILGESIELHVPKTKYVKVWSPGHDPVKTELGEETVYRWTGSHLEPTVGKDGKTKQREIDPRGELPTIAWTTFKSWEDVGAWYRGLEADRATPDAEIKAKVAELTAGKMTEEDKARALYSYVAAQIRYIGVAFGVGRYQPHPAAEVLRNQYGDCKDKHTLLAAMLAAAGLHPSAALIGAGIRTNEDVPSPGAFNHMITMVPVGGKQVWLDSTAEVAPWEMLLPVIRDKQALVVPDTGAAKLEKTPQAPPFASFSLFAAKGTLNKEGTMKAQIEYTTRGDDEIVLRTLLRQVPPGQWDDLAQRLSQGLGFSGTTSHAEAGRPDATADPAHIGYDYEREKTGDWDNHRIVPLIPPVFLANVDEKNPPQKQPIQLGELRVETALSTIKLPAGWGAELPAAVHQKTAWITLDKTYKIEDDTLTTERRMEVLQREIPASEWKAYKKWYDAALGDGEPYITLTVPNSAMEIAPGANISPETATLLQQFSEQVQGNNVKGAAETVEKIRKSDPKSIWGYRAQVTIKALQGQQDEILDATRVLLKQDSVGDQDRHAAVEIFTRTNHYEEALPLLEKMAADKPDDLKLQRSLGAAQMKTGQREKATRTLTAILPKATTPLEMNEISYDLADAGQALPQAEAASSKAIDILTEEAAAWSPGSTSKDQAAKQNLLIATWDTLGWAFFKDGNVDAAEPWLRASWRNMPSGEGAIHMGEFEEKRGNNVRAMAYYYMGLSAMNALMPVGNKLTIVQRTPNPTVDMLTAHIDALKKRGIAAPSANPAAEQMKERTLSIGPWPGKNLLEDYVVALAGDHVVASIPDSDHGLGAAGTVAHTALVLKAKAAGWTPANSRAKIIRKATLNCHSGICDLVIHPM